MNKSKRNLLGLTFGKWKVLERNNETRRSKWLCICECGTKKDVLEYLLIGEKSKSCGCDKKTRKYLFIQDEDIIRLYLEERKSTVEIAKMYSVHISTICRRLNKFGIIRKADGKDGRNGKQSKILSDGKKGGYVLILKPEHHRAIKSTGYVKEHILIAEQMLGRKLKKEEVVHHKDENKQNNDPSNLIVFENTSAHTQFHWDERKKIKFQK